MFTIPKRTIVLTAGAIFGLVLAIHIAQVAHSKRLILRGNELSHVQLVHSAVTGHTFEIDARYTDTSFHEGKSYSNKPPGYSAFMIPSYALFVKISGWRALQGSFVFLKFANAAISAAAVVLMFLLLASFGLSSASIAFGVAAATAGTLFPAYSCLANSIPLTLLLTVAAFLFVRISQQRPELTRYRAAALVCATYAIIVDYSNGFFMLPVMVVVAIDIAKRSDYGAAVPSLLPVALLLAYNGIVFDNPFALSYAYYRPPSYVPWDGVGHSLSVTNIPSGMYGLLVSPSRGMFLLSPVTLLGLVPLWVWWRQRHKQMLWIGASIALGILVMSAYELWHGGHSVGYRHILVGAVTLGMLSALAFERASRLLRAAALGVLIASSVSGVSSFFIELDDTLLSKTWKQEPANVHANFYSELLFPLFSGRN